MKLEAGASIGDSLLAVVQMQAALDAGNQTGFTVLQDWLVSAHAGTSRS
jgi:hypothetical protein